MKQWQGFSIYMNNSFPRETMQELFSNCKEIRLSKNKHLFSPGEHLQNVYWLYQGMLEICVINEKGKKQIIAVHYPDSIVGEVNALSGDETFQYCTAVRDSMLYTMNVEVFNNKLQKMGLMRDYLRLLARKVQANSIQLSIISLYDCKTRISRYYNDDLTHQQLSEVIGCSRVQVTRSLNKYKHLKEMSNQPLF